MRALLDVNMLLALFDSGHSFHAKTRGWWQANEHHGWASCPLSQNGFLRITSQGSYPRALRLADAMQILGRWAVAPRHEFWADDLTLLDEQAFDRARLLTSKQITDVYLLALAVKNGGRLVTLDRGIPLAAAKGARPQHLVVV